MDVVRQRPNILVTGTPGVGKSTVAAELAQQLGFTYFCVGQIIKEKGYYLAYNEEFDTLDVDDENLDKVCDDLEEQMCAGGCIVEYIIIDYFPKRWFDLVLVLRADTEVLYDRLTQRGYQPNKVTENLNAEIAQVILQEAFDSYDEEIIREVPSNTPEDMAAILESVQAWMGEWQPRT